MTAHPQQELTEAAYLALEHSSPVKHEYLCGARICHDWRDRTA